MVLTVAVLSSRRANILSQVRLSSDRKIRNFIGYVSPWLGMLTEADEEVAAGVGVITSGSFAPPGSRFLRDRRDLLVRSPNQHGVHHPEGCRRGCTAHPPNAT